MNKNGQPAAFYDLEGTLVSTNLVHTLAFYAKRQQGLWQTAKKSVGTLAKLPFFGITDLYSRNVFNEVFFRSYEGFSEDRLRYFSDELFEEVLKPAIFPGAFDLIRSGKKIGQRQVILPSERPLRNRISIISASTIMSQTVLNSSTAMPRAACCRLSWHQRQRPNGSANTPNAKI